ncbi:4-diphosphocytidyl-2-C-methyl-D-erythritol kinase [uncultured archaeon]|nr:4-diphosphocytidyl-2-C-methyl-D-erythritol kinase [uncultured archaeon]
MIKAHAKVNLFLSVGPRDERGYHRLKTVFQPIRELHDKVLVEESKEPGIHVKCNNPLVPKDGRNTAYRAAELMMRAAGRDPAMTGISIAIEKNVPLSSGLGGSAIDAAPVIRALNEAWRMRLNRARMDEIGSLIGADVPQALRKRTCYAEGRGDEIIEEFALKPIHACIAVPNSYLSNMNGRKTAFLYEEIDRIERTEADERPMLAALRSGSWAGIAKHMRNDFELVAFRLHPELADVKKTMRDSGALGALLAGSGGAVFGIFDDAELAHAAMLNLIEKSSVRLLLQTLTL